VIVTGLCPERRSERLWLNFKANKKGGMKRRDEDREWRNTTFLT